MVLSLQTLPPRADTESDRRCGTEWGWLARLPAMPVERELGVLLCESNTKYLNVKLITEFFSVLILTKSMPSYWAGLNCELIAECS